MTQEEFVAWQAYLRRYPRGLAWDNWVQARITQQLDALLPRAKNAKLPTFDNFVWKAPEPLFVASERERAKRRKRRN